MFRVALLHCCIASDGSVKAVNVTAGLVAVLSVTPQAACLMVVGAVMFRSSLSGQRMARKMPGVARISGRVLQLRHLVGSIWCVLTLCAGLYCVELLHCTVLYCTVLS